MADNRLQLFCKECLTMEVIAKYYPDTGWIASSLNGYSVFVAAHIACSETSTDIFKLRLESANDGYISNYPLGKLTIKL